MITETIVFIILAAIILLMVLIYTKLGGDLDDLGA